MVSEAPSLQIGYTKHLAILLSLGALAAKGRLIMNSFSKMGHFIRKVSLGWGLSK